MKDVAIVGYCRTGIAKAGRGALNQTHGIPMAAHVLREAVGHLLRGDVVAVHRAYLAVIDRNDEVIQQEEESRIVKAHAYHLGRLQSEGLLATQEKLRGFFMVLTTRVDFVSITLSGESQTGADIVCRQLWKIRQDVLLSHAGGKI